jgi:cation:H+ antiporter
MVWSDRSEQENRGVASMVWLEFFICAIVILFSGSLLSRYGDMLAEKTGMGRTWIGLILLATVTSLPELATGLSSVTVAAAPNIAVGDIMGSCVFNLMLIGIVDLFYRPGPILSRVDRGHMLSGGFGVLLIGVATWGLLVGRYWNPSGSNWIAPYTPFILILYFVAMRVVFRYEQRRMAAYIKKEIVVLRYEAVSSQKVYWNVGVHSSVIIGAGIWLPFIGSQIAQETGWGTTFVGNLLIAASTSLPEIVTSFTALRLAAPDLAIANLFGSNLFNMAILAIDDLVYVEGFLLSHASFYHVFSAITALVMTGIAITAIIYRPQKKIWVVLSWSGVALITLYLLNAYLLFILATGSVE